MYTKLRTQLERKGRMQWFLDESLSLTDPETYGISPRDLFRRTRSADKVKSQHPASLDAGSMAGGAGKVHEQTRQFVAQDSLLCRIAILSPSTVEDLTVLRGLPGGFAEKYGADVVRMSLESRSNPPSDTPEVEPHDQDWGVPPGRISSGYS
jgi:ribonuclease D